MITLSNKSQKQLCQFRILLNDFLWQNMIVFKNFILNIYCITYNICCCILKVFSPLFIVSNFIELNKWFLVYVKSQNMTLKFMGKVLINIYFELVEFVFKVLFTRSTEIKICQNNIYKSQNYICYGFHFVLSSSFSTRLVHLIDYNGFAALR